MWLTSNKGGFAAAVLMLAHDSHRILHGHFPSREINHFAA
jgi:hypothetical protein